MIGVEAPDTRRTPVALADPRRVALAVIDMQNDFVRLGAPLEVPQSRDTLPVIADLIGRLRSASIPIIYTRFLGGPNPTLVWRFNPQIASPTLFCVPGHWRTYGDVEGPREVTAIVDELAPLPGDVIVDKFGYDAFFHTHLADTLRSLGRDTLVLCGTVTQVCVDSTVRGAFHNQVRPVVVRDAVSSYDDAVAEATLVTVERSFGDVVLARDVVEALTAATVTS